MISKLRSPLLTLCLCGLCSLAITYLAHRVIDFPIVSPGKTHLTRYLHQGLLTWPGELALLGIAAAVGYFTQARKRWTVLGFILPFPIAAIYECSVTDQAHTMVLLEMAVYWLPVALVTTFGCWAGRLAAEHWRRAPGVVPSLDQQVL